MDKNPTSVGRDADPSAADQKSPKSLKGRSPQGLSPKGSLRTSRRSAHGRTATGREGLPARSKGPSLAALAALTTLAGCLWFDVELSSALFRSVLVYLGVSLMALLYRVILSHYLSISQERAQQFALGELERLQREAEEEAARARNAPAASPVSPGGKVPKSAGGGLTRGTAPSPRLQKTPGSQGEGSLEASAEPNAAERPSSSTSAKASPRDMTNPAPKAVETA